MPTDLQTLLRERILEEMKLHREITEADEYVDRILAKTVEAMQLHLIALARELKAQRMVLKERRKIKETREELVRHAADSGTIELSLPEVTLRTHVEMMVRDMKELTDEKALQAALKELDEVEVRRILAAAVGTLSAVEKERFILEQSLSE